ncbi:MAG: hypothetical protein IJM30_03500 [Thermoguttaceae bacterium]|nr:hypothetical protein [Thermoguttaceae bacterium]
MASKASTSTDFREVLRGDKTIVSAVLALSAVVSLSLVGRSPKSPDGRYPVSGTAVLAVSRWNAARFAPARRSRRQNELPGVVKDGKYSRDGRKTLLPGETPVVVTCEELTGETETLADELGKTYTAQSTAIYVPEDWGVFSKRAIMIKAGKNKRDFDIPRGTEPTPPPPTSDGKTSGGA